MKWLTLIVLVLAMCVHTPSRAASPYSALTRVDLVDGSKPYYTEAVLSSRVEVWRFGVGYSSKSSPTEMWIGRLTKAGPHLMLGGYLAQLPAAHGNSYLLPWVRYRTSLGSAQASLDAGYYLPLNGGKPRLTVPDASLVWPVGRRIRLGIVVSGLKVGDGPMPMRYGPTLRFQVGRAQIKLNWGPESYGGSAPSRLRAQAVLPL